MFIASAEFSIQSKFEYKDITASVSTIHAIPIFCLLKGAAQNTGFENHFNQALLGMDYEGKPNQKTKYESESGTTEVPRSWGSSSAARFHSVSFSKPNPVWFGKIIDY